MVLVAIKISSNLLNEDLQKPLNHFYALRKNIVATVKIQKQITEFYCGKIEQPPAVHF